MDIRLFYALAADALLVIHILVVIFIVFGLLLIFAGKLLRWQWVRNRWFRLLHLLAIGADYLGNGLACESRRVGL